MATNKKITALTELSSVQWADDDVVPIVDVSEQTTKKIQLSVFRSAVGDALAPVLLGGNTTGGTNIVVSSGDAITTNTISETTAASGVTIDSLLVKDGGITAAGTSTFAGQTITNLGAVTTADINGGTIDGTVIGGASAAAGTFTTLDATTIDTTNLEVTNIKAKDGTASGSIANSTGVFTINSVAITGGSVTGITDLAVADGGTGASTASAARTNLGAAASGANTDITSLAADIVISGSTSGDALRITQTGAGNALLVEDSSNPDSTPVVVDAGGQVGIGTSTPSSGVQLDVRGTGVLQLLNTDTVQLIASNGGSTLKNVSNNPLLFGTNNTERMRIDSSGNVGIGTTSPSGILDVEAATVNMSLNSTGTDAGSVLHFQNSGTNRGTVQLGGAGGKSMFFDVVDTAGVMYFRTQSNQTRMAIAAAGGIAMTPTSAGAGQGLSVDASGMANGSNGIFVSFASNTGNLISGNAGGAQKFAITHAGALSKTSGSFKIDHPLPAKKDTHHLVHSFIEGPQADLIYRGRADLVAGTVDVNIDTAAGMTDGTFEVLCGDVQCFTSNEDGWTALKGSVTGNILTVTAQEDSCTDTISWMVIGERKDPHMLETEWTDAAGKVIVEPLKPEPIEGE